MKRDLDGRIEFEEDEEKALMLFSGHNRQYQLDKEYMAEMLGLGMPAIDYIVDEFTIYNILKGREGTGTYALTPFGRECAAFLKARSEVAVRQRDFLKRLNTGVTCGTKSAGYADRYQTGKSIGCNKVETDYLCAEMQSSGLIEPEMKNITVFPGSSFERVREIPTQKVRLTDAGINWVKQKDKILPDRASEEHNAGKGLLPEVRKTPGLIGDLLGSQAGGTADLETDQAVDNISGFLRTVVLIVLAMGLTILVVFYK
ncbi:hypothetical protein [Methanocella sp. MCL-LM]|uniref:hypothetical protein n=1 Tax=Methanocella sp. MCL-LM TaxID=3412035 RepID=UPI003C78E15E